MISFSKGLELTEEWEAELFGSDTVSVIEVMKDPLNEDKPVFIQVSDRDKSGAVYHSACIALTLEQSQKIVDEIIAISLEEAKAKKWNGTH